MDSKKRGTELRLPQISHHLNWPKLADTFSFPSHFDTAPTAKHRSVHHPQSRYEEDVLHQEDDDAKESASPSVPIPIMEHVVHVAAVPCDTPGEVAPLDAVTEKVSEANGDHSVELLRFSALKQNVETKSMVSSSRDQKAIHVKSHPPQHAAKDINGLGESCLPLEILHQFQSMKVSRDQLSTELERVLVQEAFRQQRSRKRLVDARLNQLATLEQQHAAKRHLSKSRLQGQLPGASAAKRTQASQQPSHQSQSASSAAASGLDSADSWHYASRRSRHTSYQITTYPFNASAKESKVSVYPNRAGSAQKNHSERRHYFLPPIVTSSSAPAR
jgi:hypothetical protein